MNKIKKMLFYTAALALTGILGACSSTAHAGNSASSHDKISIMQNTDLLSLDNSNIADVTSYNVFVNSMEGLYRTDANEKLAPGIATSIAKPTNDGKTYTFHLRKNAKWSNGDPVTAEDFIKAWQRSVSPDAKSGYNYIFSGIKNADQISAGKLSPSKLGATAPDSHTLKVELTHPMPYFNKMMILPAFFPQSTAALKKFGKNYGTNSSRLYYDGAFKVTGWTGSSDTWKLIKNDDYYDAKAIRLDEIDEQVVKDPNTAHNLFEKGQLDDATISGVTAQGLQKDKDLRHVQKAGTNYLRLNTKSGKQLSNQKMRQALSLAIDRNHLTKDILADGSQPAYTYVSKNLATDPTTGKDFATETQPSDTYDLKKAKQLWAEGLKESHIKGTVTLSLIGADDTASKNVAQYVQGALQQELPQLKINMESLPDKSLQDKMTSSQFDFDQTLWLADFGDPIDFFSILTSSNPQNYGKYDSKAFDSDIADASGKNATNQTKYWADMRDAQKQLNEDMPIIPLYSMTESHLVNPKLKGVEYHPVGETDYTRAYLK